MAKPLLYLEDIDTAPRHPIAQIGQTTVNITDLAPLSLAATFVGGIGLSVLTNPSSSWWGHLIKGKAYGLALQATNLSHSLGHIISARASGAPMDELLITSTRHATLYQNNQVPSSAHIGRSIGGPLGNLTLAFLIWLLAGRTSFGRTMALVNLGTALAALLPIHDVDGEVIWREVGKMAERKGA